MALQEAAEAYLVSLFEDTNLATMLDLKFRLYVSQCGIYCENGKKIVSCSRFRSYFWGTKPGPRPMALAFQYPRPSFCPQAGAGTSLVWNKVI